MTADFTDSVSLLECLSWSEEVNVDLAQSIQLHGNKMTISRKTV